MTISGPIITLLFLATLIALSSALFIGVMARSDAVSTASLCTLLGAKDWCTLDHSQKARRNTSLDTSQKK